MSRTSPSTLATQTCTCESLQSVVPLSIPNSLCLYLYIVMIMSLRRVVLVNSVELLTQIYKRPRAVVYSSSNLYNDMRHAKEQRPKSLIKMYGV